MNEIRGSSHIRGILLSFIIFHSRIALFFSIFSYVTSGKTISAKTVIYCDYFFITFMAFEILIENTHYLSKKFYSSSNNNLMLKVMKIVTVNIFLSINMASLSL